MQNAGVDLFVAHLTVLDERAKLDELFAVAHRFIRQKF